MCMHRMSASARWGRTARNAAGPWAIQVLRFRSVPVAAAPNFAFAGSNDLLNAHRRALSGPGTSRTRGATPGTVRREKLRSGDLLPARLLRAGPSSDLALDGRTGASGGNRSPFAPAPHGLSPCTGPCDTTRRGRAGGIQHVHSRGRLSYRGRGRRGHVLCRHAVDAYGGQPGDRGPPTRARRALK